ncbi:Gfo/Idh/MocA family oxidoreductase [Otoolea muris]|uniref:Gfo/Idh/MocA family oxidoreductase n=1 Tax=Otoolea muris TaxID=2941515 RepID=UPI0020411EBC|nr:Gfo/Idh/MocA family oxidoreductase [Otoolea muris]
MDQAYGKRIRVGLAGFGMSGKIFHAPFIYASQQFELRKVYERTSDHSRQEYPDIEIVRSFEKLLADDIDLVVISTPNQYHVPMAVSAMQAGKHVIVEKPAAATSKEAAELCRIAADKKVILSIYQNRRLDGDFLTVKKLINEDRLGEIVDYECHFDRFVEGKSKKSWKREGGKGIDLLYDIGIHMIDQAYVLFGMPYEVYADLRKQRKDSSGIDNFEIHLYYTDKRIILSAGELVVESGPHFMVHGRKATFIKYGQDIQECRLLNGKRPGTADWGQDEENSFGTVYTMLQGKILQEKIPTETGNYGEYYDNIYRAIAYGEKLLVKPEESVDVLRIVEAIQKSNEEKRRINL